MNEMVEKLQEWIWQSDNIVFFGGAGVSTESGIPDFRGKDGLYDQEYDVPPEIILSHDYFFEHPEEFYRFYREKMICTCAKPNAAHRKLVELEQAGKLKAVITQNIDGLHQMAGSQNVLELHGSVFRNFCVECGARYDLEDILSKEGVPYCHCGGLIKPNVVLYGENLNWVTTQKACQAIRNAQMLIVAGTSLSVYPAAGMITEYRGGKLVLINRDETAYDDRADLLIHGNVGEILGQIEVKHSG